jgi:hypothetical protein
MKSTQYKNQQHVQVWGDLLVRFSPLFTIRCCAKLIVQSYGKGTKKLQGAVKAIQGRGQHILRVVDAYNKLVDELSAMKLPTWMLPEHMPTPLDRRTVIDIDPDGPLWEDMALGNIWVILWGIDYEQTPPYVRDPRVRKGIKYVLLLDRISEEEKRLAIKQHNLCTEFVHSLFLISDAWLAVAGSLCLSLIAPLMTLLIGTPVAHRFQ